MYPFSCGVNCTPRLTAEVSLTDATDGVAKAGQMEHGQAGAFGGALAYEMGSTQ